MKPTIWRIDNKVAKTYKFVSAISPVAARRTLQIKNSWRPEDMEICISVKQWVDCPVESICDPAPIRSEHGISNGLRLEAVIFSDSSGVVYVDSRAVRWTEELEWQDLIHVLQAVAREAQENSW